MLAQPPPIILFLPRRGGARRLLEYAIAHPATSVYIRSDAFGDEVDSQVPSMGRDAFYGKGVYTCLIWEGSLYLPGWPGCYLMGSMLGS